MIFSAAFFIISGGLLGLSRDEIDHETRLKVISFLLTLIGALCVIGGIAVITKKAKEEAINEYLNGELEIEESKTYKIK